jgi:glycosyltransferase involved in cell wall biosynthesis
MKVSLVLLTLNEIEGMKVIMPQIKNEWYDELLIIDGGSTDGSVEYARERGYQLIQTEKGLGPAFHGAMTHATGDMIILFSPDGNSIPDRIPLLIGKMKEGYDMVIVSRYLDGAKSDDDDSVTAFGNWMFTKLINFLFGANITDSLVIYRAFNRSIIEELNIDTQSNSYQTQILLRAIKHGLRIGEISGDEPARIGGKRKMHPIRNGIQELVRIGKEYFYTPNGTGHNSTATEPASDSKDLNKDCDFESENKPPRHV